jgi:hypothetical protein
MASSAEWSISSTPTWVQEFRHAELLKTLREMGKKASEIILARFKVTQALPNALADIEEGYTNVANNLDCATDLVHVLSSDADDKHDGAGAQAVRIWYIKSGAISSADFDLEGATHVHLASLGTIDRIIGMEVIGSVNGTNAVVVPQGNIIIDVHAGGTVYCTIVAGDLYSITSKMWVPTGYTMAAIEIIPLITIVEAAGPLLTDGSNVGININGTVHSRSVLPENIGRPFVMPMPFDKPLAGEAYICLQHSQLDTDATAVTETLIVTYCLVKD